MVDVSISSLSAVICLFFHPPLIILSSHVQALLSLLSLFLRDNINYLIVAKITMVNVLKF